MSFDNVVEDGVDPLQDDYYTFLNVSRDATTEEIANAFRRLSKFYHPDKHHSDPEKKKEAEILFNKIKKAYDVLTDPHRRAIYDTLGARGLETEGWEIVHRTKTPQEIREEYERLLQEKEERLLQQRTNPKGLITVGINATDLFSRYGYDDDDDDDFHLHSHFPRIEISSMSISQSIDATLNTYNTFSLSGNLNSQNGTGNGQIAGSLRHVISASTWTEFEFAAGHGPVITLKGFRTLSKRTFATAHGMFHFSPAGIRPGMHLVLGRHLDKHLAGYLTWKAGLQSCMNTMLVWDSRCAHVIASIQFGIPNSFLMFSYQHKMEKNETKLKGSIKLGTFGVLLEYGCETRISRHSIIGASMIVGVPSGITLKIKINRASQNYLFPILLSDELIPSAIFYGTLAPLLSYYCLRVFIINPYKEREKEKEQQKSRQTNATKIAERKREAQVVVNLMQEAYNRILEAEKEKSGLIITRAIYGNATVIDNYAENDDTIPADIDLFEVNIPLQCLVKDSLLQLPAASKANLPGFYDPCLLEEKKLYIRYHYKNLLHAVIIGDLDSVKIPSETHLVR